MPDAILVQVAEAVKDLLNTPATFSQSFTAARSYPTWKVPLTSLGSLRVDVVPSSHIESPLDSQGSTEYTCRLIVVIRKRFAQTERSSGADNLITNASVDALVKLVEEVHEFLCGQSQRRLATVGLDATWQETKIQNTYIDEHLSNNQQFTGIVRVTYRATKAV